jgi:hypothetical protein
MPKADQIAERASQLEAEYRSKLIAALRECASGRWGLFGHNDHLSRKAPVVEAVQELEELGRDLDALRARIDLGPFPLHERFLAVRGPVGPNAVGEPKQAQAWLAELADA